MSFNRKDLHKLSFEILGSTISLFSVDEAILSSWQDAILADVAYRGQLLTPAEAISILNTI